MKSRFVNPGNPERPFIPSQLEDNPFLDLVDYEKSLSVLDEITYQKLRFGNWEVRAEGAFFKTSMIEVVEEWPESMSNPDPDYTVGAKVAIAAGVCYIIDIIRGRWEPAEVDRRILQSAKIDGYGVRIICEEEGGSGGKRTISSLSNLLQGFSFPFFKVHS